MDNKELGRRLKAARLAKKMTQSDVVGDFITRNMLSQIESGSATPSMKTLEYLAGVLEVPMERLLADQGGPTEPEAISLLVRAKVLLKEQNYDALLQIKESTSAITDELHALHSIAHLELAKQLSDSQQTEQMQAAVMHARLAIQEAESGIYANESRSAEAKQLITKIAQYLSSYYSDLAQTGNVSGN
ncbi:MAG: helix-turn-helix transcriptional regulator [Oscillospiraceae bacterium]|nr:helix-turn-helix transcriptional regulator [Oscillospiraceae bacterium]